MRSLRGCGRGGCGWRARCCPWGPRRRASPCRRLAAVRDRSFEHPDAVAQLGRELEVLHLDRAPQLLLQVEQLEPRVRLARRPGHGVALADVLARAVEAAPQVAQMRREGLIALGAAEPPGFAELLERAAAGGAAQAVGGRREHVGAPLPHGLDEAAEP